MSCFFDSRCRALLSSRAGSTIMKNTTILSQDHAIQPNRRWHCRRFCSADFGIEVAHNKQHVPLGDLFNYLRQVLVEHLHLLIRSCCRWSIHLNQSNISWFHLESHNKDSVADWFMSHKCSSDFPKNPYCHSWHALSKSTWVYYCMAIQCCEMPLSVPSHLW